MGVPGKGAATPPHQLGDLGERCELPAGFVAEPRPPKGFSIIFTTEDGLSWQCNIVNCGLSCSQWGPRTPCPLAYAPGTSSWWKKRSERRKHWLRAGCSKAETKVFAPPETHFAVAQDGQNLTSWRWSLPSPTEPVWWRSMHAISSYHGNSPTKPQTHNARPPVAHRQDR